MDKEFILRYLKEEHISNNENLAEIAELSGLEVVKTLLRNHESMRLNCIPLLNKNKKLMYTVISDNYKSMSVKHLSDLTGLRRSKVQEIIKELEDIK